jgi:hypothetical protein
MTSADQNQPTQIMVCTVSYSVSLKIVQIFSRMMKGFGQGKEIDSLF